MKPPMFFRSLIAGSLLLPALWANPRFTWAHAYPASVSPADGSTLTQTPREIRIQFTEGVELEFSRIDVKSSNGEKVTAGKIRKVAEDTLAIDLKPIGPGAYTIEWQVLSVDTHMTEGVLRFTAKAAGK